MAVPALENKAQPIRRRIKSRNTRNHSSSSSSSINYIDKLPDNLLWEILIEVLPSSRSAAQCKLVCKRWLSLISDPHFLHGLIHRNHQYSHVDFMLQSYKFTGSDIQPFIPTLETSGEHHLVRCVPRFRVQDTLPLSIVAYCGDLLLFSDCLTRRNSKFYICNSLTKQWVALPPPPSQLRMLPVGLVCYPAYCADKEQPCYLRYNYKVVRIYIPCNLPTDTDDCIANHKFYVEIFSSETRQWKICKVLSPSPLNSSTSSKDRFYQPVVTYNGILHWVNPKLNIVAYDPLNNLKQCRIIHPPPHFEHDSFNSLGVCRGRMRLSRKTYIPDYSGYHFSVWELEDHSSWKWQLVHETDSHDLVPADSWLAKVETSPSYFKFLAFHPFDVDIVFLRFYNRIVSYNLENKLLTLVSKLQGDDDVPYNHSPILQLYPIVHPWWPTPVPSLPVDAVPC